ncbi:uncharacterized protein DUF4233 [Micromonospora kangleipakensis]|uniref:Uncharacterized protein DUF4233 n=1 Tax=Micromonospora kangleipakensis TaxID=1077942 RepID=A0A4V2GDX9_9ACTN|nr:DUF4233 domain-containing protein [Micromonospora kangleipakensis]RZU77666.1 uncharacterized protein DUF4233 [Micromonospora kangleipakensis]
MTGPVGERPEEVVPRPDAGPRADATADRPGRADSAPAAAGPGPEDAGSGPVAGGPGARRSGLRNPEKAVRGLGAGTLALEALVLLLAIQPIRVVGGDLGGAAIAAIVALAVACVVLAGRMGRPWAWHAGTALQGLLMLSGLLHWSLLVLGVIFALVWAYALHVRRVILG